MPSVRVSFRLFFSVWFFTSMILMKSYGAIFYTVLSFPEREESLETLDDLERVSTSPDHFIVTIPDSFYFDVLTNTPCCGPSYVVGRHLKASKHPFPLDLQGGIKMISDAFLEDKTVIFILFADALIYGARFFATVDMHISSETLYLDQMGMAVQKGSPILPAMDKA